MSVRIAKLFLMAAALCSPTAKAVYLDAFACSDDANSEWRYKMDQTFSVCVNPAGDYASNYKLNSLKSVSCKEGQAIVIGNDYIIKNGSKPLDSASLAEHKGRGKKKASPNGMGFETTAIRAFFDEGERRVVCKGLAEVDYTEPCEQQSYTLPTTEYDPTTHSKMVTGTIRHGGFCVIGAKDASAFVSENGASYADYTYETVHGLADGTRVWDDPGKRFKHLEGNICEGGIFLRPSGMYIPQGLDVTIETTEKDGESDGVTICAFVEPPYGNGGVRPVDRGGKWMQQLIDQGFERKGKISYISTDPERLHVLCKLMSEPCEEGSRRGRSLKAIEELNFETDVDIGDSCPADVAVLNTVGVTPYPRDGIIDPPVNIISQDKSTVTVEIVNNWDKHIEKMFLSYRTDNFSSKCFEETEVLVGQATDPLTIQCKVTSPYAFLRICLQDDDLLFGGDDAKVSSCCHPENIDGRTVCYNIEIRCETSCVTEESRRYLRAIAM